MALGADLLVLCEHFLNCSTLRGVGCAGFLSNQFMPQMVEFCVLAL
jgi:hypothetical protein